MREIISDGNQQKGDELATKDTMASTSILPEDDLQEELLEVAIDEHMGH